MAKAKSVVLTRDQISDEIKVLVEGLKRYNAGDFEVLKDLRYVDAVGRLKYLRTLLTRFSRKDKR